MNLAKQLYELQQQAEKLKNDKEKLLNREEKSETVQRQETARLEALGNESINQREEKQKFEAQKDDVLI